MSSSNYSDVKSKIAYITSMGWEVMSLGHDRYKVEDVALRGIFLYGGVDVLDRAIDILTCDFTLER